MLSLLNCLLCTGFGLVLLWLILTPKVDDGVIIKLGMIVAMLGFLALGWKMFEGIEPSEIRGVEWGMLMVNVGCDRSSATWGMAARAPAAAFRLRVAGHAADGRGRHVSGGPERHERPLLDPVLLGRKPRRASCAAAGMLSAAPVLAGRS